MCGIAGILNFKDKSPLNDLITLSNGIKHRGPDDEGYYVIHELREKGYEYLGDTSNPNITGTDNVNRAKSEYFKYGIIHRRFSILDTSIKGHQPIKTGDNQIIMSFNGEIFNYIELRDGLIKKGYKFISTSDTEVVIKSYQEWGVNCFNKFNGFWAISFLDLKKNVCVLSRDRFGQKPLYYYKRDDTFYFSSEINNLRNVCTEINTINKTSAYLYLYHDRRDSLTCTMYKNLRCIEPSSFMIIDLNTGENVSKPYWNFPTIDESNSNKSADELADELSSIIDKAVKIRLRSDVPFAANLSGGLDSATIVYHASKILKKENKKLTTHTFEYKNNEKLSEKNEAALIAKQCNTHHNVLCFDSEDVWKDLKDLVKTLEEPVHSPAAYIQWIAWKKIADLGFKVILHGSANDELMMGYSYYAELLDKYKISRLEFPLRMQGNSIFYYKNIVRILKWFVKRELFFKKDYRVIKHPVNQVFNYHFLEKNVENYNEIVGILEEANTGEKRRMADFKYLRIPFWNNFMDKSMMSIPIEVRLPFLDKNIVEFCFKHASKVFYKKGWPKYLLRKSLKQNLSKGIIWNNRKKGFTSPKGSWLRENKKVNLQILNSTIGLKKFVDLDFIEKNYENLDQDLLWRVINFSIWLDICEVKI